MPKEIAKSRICFISSCHAPDDKRVFYKEAICLAENGYEVFHLAPSDRNENNCINQVQLILYKSSIRVGSLTSIFSRLKQLLSLYKLARKVDADIYHANEFDTWLLVLFLKVSQKKVIVFDVHEFYPDLISRRRLFGPLRRIFSNMIKLCFYLFANYTDLIIFANKYLRKDFPARIANTVDVENYGFPNPNLSASIGNKSCEPITVMYAGLIGRERGIFTIFDAISRMTNKSVRMKLIGRLTDFSRAELFSEINKYKLNDRVAYTEWLPYDELLTELCTAHIGFTYLSDSTDSNSLGLPHKMFDYMAAGLCLLVDANALYVSEIVSETNCGVILHSKNAEDIANVLDNLCIDQKELIHKGASGITAVNSKFNWTTQSKKLLDAYEQLELVVRNKKRSH